METFTRIFRTPKPVIAMLHLPALPGRPLHDRTAGVMPAVESVGRDLDALQEAGVDGVYTPKDFEINRIMGEIADLVAERHRAAQPA